MLRIEGGRVDLRDWRLDDLESYCTWMQPGQRWQEFDYRAIKSAKMKGTYKCLILIRKWMF